MSFEMTLWRVDGTRLDKVDPSKLEQEERLEEWIDRDSSILGMEVAVVGRQVQTRFGGRIDLLAIDRSANCVILELKRGRTPRDVVAQVLDYATWVKDLGYAELDQISLQHRKKSLNALFEDTFGAAIPDTVE